MGLSDYEQRQLDCGQTPERLRDPYDARCSAPQDNDDDRVRCDGCEFRVSEDECIRKGDELLCTVCVAWDVEHAALDERNAFLATWQREVAREYRSARHLSQGAGIVSMTALYAADLSRLERMARGVE